MLLKDDINDCLAFAVAVHPQFPVDTSMVDAYYELLKDLNCSKNELFVAIKAVLEASSWFPTVALIRSEVLKDRAQPIPFDAREFATVRRQLTNGDTQRESIGYVGSPQY